MDERKHVHLDANRLGKAVFLPFILQIFLGFRFLTRVPMGKYLPV